MGVFGLYGMRAVADERALRAAHANVEPAETADDLEE
jgi:hypothetical protein